ncbi:MAG: 3-deoxy-7-phosphoheptulonate synthase [Patescibacteria group bacterium]
MPQEKQKKESQKRTQKRLALKEAKEDPTLVAVGNVIVGKKNFVVMAGPCAVESKEQVERIARIVKNAGGKILRGGAYKPRTSPYSFQGLEAEGLKLLHDAARRNGLFVVSEIVDAEDVPLFEEYVDLIQVGARNMQNFSLLKRLGKTKKPILLKRGMTATVDEWLYSAEYILHGGNSEVILCERGIRTFETSTRNTLDISAVPVVKQKSHLPVIIDPSHAAGRRDIIPALAKAALAVGADGILIDIHDDHENALCDGDQALGEVQYKALVKDLVRIAPVFEKKLL